LSEYAVDVPSIPLGLSASVVGVRLIRLNWITPVDTGVGDNSRPVVKFVLEQSTSPILDTIQTTFEPGPLVATLTVEVPTTGPSPFYFRIAANKEGKKKGERRKARKQILSQRFLQSKQIGIAWGPPVDTGIDTGDRLLLGYRCLYLPVSITTCHLTSVFLCFFAGLGIDAENQL